MDQLKAKIRHVPDFPKAGILFYDITTLLQDPVGFRAAIDSLSQPYTNQGIDRNTIANARVITAGVNVTF